MPKKLIFLGIHLYFPIRHKIFYSVNVNILCMKFNKIPPIHKGLVNVIIETPKESQNKFDFDPKLGIFRLKKPFP
jgi:hypothetical protein